MQPENVAKISTQEKAGDICLRASSLLKQLVNSSWGEQKDAMSAENKENINAQ